jgi:hypothetical protein
MRVLISASDAARETGILIDANHVERCLEGNGGACVRLVKRYAGPVEPSDDGIGVEVESAPPVFSGWVMTFPDCPTQNGCFSMPHATLTADSRPVRKCVGRFCDCC